MANEPNHPYRESQEPSKRPTTKTIELEFVLTISMSDYCKANNKELSDYVMVGVHGDHPQFRLAKEISVPYLTEIVVDYILMTLSNNLYYSGTALIPKSILSPKE